MNNFNVYQKTNTLQLKEKAITAINIKNKSSKIYIKHFELRSTSIWLSDKQQYAIWYTAIRIVGTNCFYDFQV